MKTHLSLILNIILIIFFVNSIYAQSEPDLLGVWINDNDVEGETSYTISMDELNSFKFRVRFRNKGDDAAKDISGITISIDKFYESNDKNMVSNGGDTDNDFIYDEYLGYGINGNYGDTYADYVMTEVYNPNVWDGIDYAASDKKTFELDITPKGFFTHRVYYRAWMGESWSSVVYDPSGSGSGISTDCSSFYAYYIDIEIKETDKPDLVVENLSVWKDDGSDIEPGDKLEYSYRVKNIGAAESGSCEAKFQLLNSNKAVISETLNITNDSDNANGIDELNPESTEEGYFQDKSSDYLHKIELPTNIEAGDYYIRVLVDSEEDVIEENDENNSDDDNIKVIVKRPDLVITNYEVASGWREFYIGDKIHWTLTVENIGKEEAQKVPYIIVISEDNLYQDTDIILIENTIVDPDLLGGGLDVDEETTIGSVDLLVLSLDKIEIPVGISENQDYYIIFVIDPEKTGGESDWSNNERNIEVHINKKSDIKLFEQSSIPINDGTIDVKVNASGYQGDDIEVYAHYKASDRNWREHKVKLVRQEDGFYIGSLPNLSRKQFHDGEKIRYWYVAENSNNEISSLPDLNASIPYIETTAIYGSSNEGLVVVDPGQNMLSVSIERDEVDGKINNTITFTNNHSLYMACKARLNGWSVDNSMGFSDEDLASALGGIARNDNVLFIGGNKINPKVWPPQLVDKYTLKYSNILTIPGSKDDFKLDIDRDTWEALTLDVTQTLFEFISVIAKKSIEADSVYYKKYIAASDNTNHLKQTSETVDNLIKEIGIAYLITLRELMIDDLKNPNNQWYKELNVLVNRQSSDLFSEPIAFLMKYITNKTIRPGFIPKFIDNLNKPSAEDIAKIFSDKVLKAANLYNKAYKAAKAVANLGWKVYDFFTLPKYDRIVLENKRLLDAKAEFAVPFDLSSINYPNYMQEVVKDWEISTKGGVATFKVKVINEGEFAISNVWVGLDIYNKSELINEQIIEGEKVENTYTPVKDLDIESGGTGLRGNIKFNAFLIDEDGQLQLIDDTFIDENGDDDPSNDEIYGQGVTISPHQEVEFIASYPMNNSVTGHNYTSGNYLIKYAVYHNGYPGSEDGEVLITPVKGNLMVMDYINPKAPFETDSPNKPFNLEGASDDESVALVWTGVNLSENPDVVFYRIQRSNTGSQQFEDIAIIDNTKFNYFDISDLISGNSYSYRVSAIDNGGNESVYDEITIAIINQEDLIAPFILNPSNEERISDLAPTIYWTNEEYVTEYNLQIAYDSQFENVLIDEKTTETSLLVNLSNSQQYFIRVRSLNNEKTSDWSDPIKFFTEILDPILEVTPKELNVDSDWGQASIQVSNIGTGSMVWEASSETDWIHIAEGNNGINNGSFVFTYEKNESDNRTGVIKVECMDATESIISIGVNQMAGNRPSPVLQWLGGEKYDQDGVDPDNGNSTTEFKFKIKYTSDLNLSPFDGYPKLHLLKSGQEVEGSPFIMERNDVNLIYSDGVEYQYSISELDIGGDYSYYFKAKDVDDHFATGEPINNEAGPVIHGLDAEFSADKKEGIDTLTVQFTDQSTGDSISWLWDFGDGNTSSEQHPEHNYTVSGTYTVSLTVSDGIYADTMIKTDFIIVTEIDESISVIYPNGGESLEKGSQYLITWEDNIYNTVNIQLYMEDTLYRDIATEEDSDGSYSWDIPTSLKAGSNYKIKISSSTNSNLTDESDAFFSLIEPTSFDYITVTSPNGPIDWYVGSTHNITWESNLGGDVEIAIISSSGWRYVISESEPNNGIFSWEIPSILLMSPSQYKIEIKSTSDPNVSDTSDDYFYPIGDQPSADFTADVRTGYNPLEVEFTGELTAGLGDGSVRETFISWFWDFESDGDFDSNEQNPKWIYTEPGIYTVSLWVTIGSLGSTEVKENYITVSNSPENIETDSLALVALYNECDGPNWTNNTNWLETPVKEWFGVTVENNRVVKISLQGQYLQLFGLKNSIPKEIGNLSFLRYLYLSDNQLSGSIPVELGNLSNLVYLGLFNNQLSGSIPIELANLNNLNVLSLSNNELTGTIPVELGGMSNLSYLSLSDNQLIGQVPVEIGNLSDLVTLDLSKNQLSGSLPVELGNLTNFIVLSLDNNQFTFSNLAHSGIFDGDIENFEYSPQAKLIAPVQSEEYQYIILSIPEGHENNSYAWYRNDAKIDDVDSTSLIISDHEGGMFFCKITNPLYPILELKTEELFIVNSTGIGDYNLQENINIYPNPTRDKLIIEIANSVNERFAFEIYDIKGLHMSKFEEIAYTNNLTIKVNCSEFSNGLYYLKIISKDGIAIKNFIVAQ